MRNQSRTVWKQSCIVKKRSQPVSRSLELRKGPRTVRKGSRNVMKESSTVRKESGM